MRLLLFPFRFGNDLHISNKLFVLDAGASGSKDMKVLRNHLQEIRSQIVSVSMPACEGQEPASAQPPVSPGGALPSWFGSFPGAPVRGGCVDKFLSYCSGWRKKEQRGGDGCEVKGLLWAKWTAFECRKC